MREYKKKRHISKIFLTLFSENKDYMYVFEYREKKRNI